ncbi:tubulin-like doman-containing protein [Frankia sp. AgB32]|uniref:tubulin-like doman-containing protein n=1 Tax=Frankia sp. AgB32 TaxID=631119 RepID=UPI00200F3F4A|nr:tubulin-like doman-containing protein [Frankia sp. AgB32]MCK9896901.1 tubulin-like doman-containing protein [Frankia sp. AgB32]
MPTPDSAFGLNIYQPLLYVGLGGTGCAIGTELERRLRQALCGPDGRAFAERMGVHGNSGYLPFQLPGCLQFVYADLNEAELDRIHGSTVPAPVHHQAAARNAHLVRGLVPRFQTYAQVAGNLRMTAGEFVQSWLPPTHDEPLVAPITRGAGQLPTVGRAALFETVREDVGPGQQPLREAIDAVSRAGAELGVLGGKSNRSCDVFVAFSVAGGTGAGIFYDYLHLIADAFDRAGIGAQIYPIVLMPSAFDEGRGGGRSAQLNAGRALLDLFRLVDDQNARKARRVLGHSDNIGRPIDIAYPGRKIQIAPGTVQTGFLFSRTPGMDKDDIHRSIASLVLSLITSEQQAGHAAVIGQSFQSFADSFINSAATRNTAADSGIGHRGVSTALVASLTVPGDDLAELVAGRLLARAVPLLDMPGSGGNEQNVPLIGRMARAADLGDLLERSDLPVGPPRAVDGAAEIRRSLTDYSDSIGAVLRAHANQLSSQVQELAGQRFQPVEAVKVMLGETDVFRLQRVIRGHPELLNPNDITGLIGLLEARRNAPSQPPNAPGVTAAAPVLPDVRNRLTHKAKWGDPNVQQALATLQRWHRWNTWRLWHEAWGRQSRVWQPKMNTATGYVNDFAEALRVFGRAEPDEFDRRTAALSQDRTGIRQLLPAGGNLDVFYRSVLRAFLQRGGHPEGATEADVLRVLLRGDDWQRAFEEISERGQPQRAVASLRDRLKQQVRSLFAEAEGGSVPLLPSMGRLLARAASSAAPDVDPLDLRKFHDQLRALLPGGFSPDGSGQLKVLIAHPTVKQVPDGEVQSCLRRELALPVDQGTLPEFRAGQPDSIVVVLFRTSMAVNEVREVRELLRFWSQALVHNDPADYLRWRQRLGYNFGWLAMTEDNRKVILHRLLCAMWNGQVTVTGSLESPESVLVRAVDYDEAQSMYLPLRRVGQTSSWGSLLRAYEQAIVEDDDEARRAFTRSLRTIRPAGHTAEPVAPAEVFDAFIDVAGSEAEQIMKVREGLPAASRGRLDQLLEFWTSTVSAALDLPFPDDDAIRGNLRDLYAYVTGAR